MYATSGGAPAAIKSSLKKENPYYSSEQQQPTNTTSRKLRKMRALPAKAVKHARPAAISDGFLHQMFSTHGGQVKASPAALAQMTQAQQIQKMMSMRAETMQQQREDQALREYARVTQGGTVPAEEVRDRLARQLELSDAQLSGRPFVQRAAAGTGYETSGAAAVGAMTRGGSGWAQAGAAAPPAAPACHQRQLGRLRVRAGLSVSGR